MNSLNASPALNSVRLINSETWQEQLQHAIRDIEELAAVLDIDPSDLNYSTAADKSFPLLVPRAFVSRMEIGKPNDPLLLQVLAHRKEELEVEGFTNDPLQETGDNQPHSGHLQKYQSRVLFILTGQCAINCRYCFRRHFPYENHRQSTRARLSALDDILADDSVREIIFSGGDPLLLPDDQLAALCDHVAQHAQNTGKALTVRVHTRLPIVIPDRVTDRMLDALTHPLLRTVVVVHSNHPQEIDAATAAALQRMRDAKITVLNQAVLLSGINDDAETLAQLSDALFSSGTLPYYLHLLDRVAGAAHFDVSPQRGRELVGELAALRPGYLVPKLMTEVPGAASKRELSPRYSV